MTRHHARSPRTRRRLALPSPAATAGTVRTISVYGRPHRVCVEGYLVVDELYGQVEAASFMDVYL